MLNMSVYPSYIGKQTERVDIFLKVCHQVFSWRVERRRQGARQYRACSRHKSKAL